MQADVRQSRVQTRSNMLADCLPLLSVSVLVDFLTFDQGHTEVSRRTLGWAERERE